MLLIGIDEAGYGPLLGPLCHGYVALRCVDCERPDVWELLKPHVSRHPAEDDALCIDDSKKVYGGAGGLANLARGVAAFLPRQTPASDPRCHATLFARLVRALDHERLHADPWGRAPESLPESPLPDVAAFRTAHASRGVECVALGARAMSARDFNQAVARHGNKAAASWSRVAEELRALAELAAPGETVFAVVDRQGGRKFYGALLGELFEVALPIVELESERSSIYRVEWNGRKIRVAFEVDGDGGSLPVALASMAAKLAREICMERLNAYFQRYKPDLKPTAGYYGDAQRFLKDTKELRRRLEVDDAAFIRVK